MAALKKTKTVRFFSPEEKKVLNSIIVMEKGKERREKILQFCKTYKRKSNSVYTYISNQKNKNSKNVVSRKQSKLLRNNIVSTITKNEFHIPITNWEMRTNESGTMLVLKF